MSLVAEIVWTAVLACVAVILLLVAVVGDHTRTAWLAFGVGIVAHALFLDSRMRWREAQRYGGELRSIN